ncbi:general secretion pathway protein GspB [Vibrio rarus]|uniref:general secretion pathway protein GspB n=1 Tax=Vibrio rarus TaxID=413403 RepID=UPI0021C479AB|nr:general secretion pathway protein GspB [Vibrio rarus]
MSQVLKALEQSQKQFEQTLPSQPSVTRPQHSAGNGKTKVMLAVALGLLVGGGGYMAFPDSSLTHSVEALVAPALSHFVVSQSIPSDQPAESSNIEMAFLPIEPSKGLLPLPQLDPALRDKPSTITVNNEKPLPQTQPNVQHSSHQSVSKTTTKASTTHKASHTTKTASTAKHTSPSGSDDGEWNLSKLDLSKLSPELAGRISNVLDNPSEYKVDEVDESKLSNVKLIKLDQDGDRFKGHLPALNLQTHMYASNPKHRWVKVNGKELQQGQAINKDTKLVEIAPRYIVIEYLGEKIQIPALYDWKG